MIKIDLHTHSNASDGRLSPKLLIERALSKKIPAIALTDHDNIDGLIEAAEYSKNKNIEFVPGVEFSANPGDLAKEIHIVGLFVDVNNHNVQELIVKQKEFRVIGNEKLLKKLNELGYKLTYEEVAKESENPVFGRPAFALALMKKYPQFKESRQVFDELLGKNGKAFFKNESTLMDEIINVIHAAGGIAILAHPGYLYDEYLTVVTAFVRYGGDGIEVDCPYESFGDKAQSIRDKFRKIAKENKLIISGGTDFHELLKGKAELGDFGITLAEFKVMKSYVKNKFRK